MDFKMPVQDRIGKISSVLQTVLFLVLLISVYFFLSRIVHGFFFRLLLFIGDYIVVSLFMYLVIKPMAEIIENKIRARKQ